MNPDELVILFDGKSELTVLQIESTLESEGIPSVRISSGYSRNPHPTGLRVKFIDLERARQLIQMIDIDLYSEIIPKEKEVDNKTQWFIIVPILLVAIIFFILFLTGVIS